MSIKGNYRRIYATISCNVSDDYIMLIVIIVRPIFFRLSLIYLGKLLLKSFGVPRLRPKLGWVWGGYFFFGDTFGEILCGVSILF